MNKKLIIALASITLIINFVIPVRAQEDTESDNNMENTAPLPQEEMIPGNPVPAPQEQMPPQMGFPARQIIPPPTVPVSSAESQNITTDTSDRISLELKGMDILDALKLLSKKSGLNIVAGKNVRGNVTIYLKDVDVWDALRIILETNDLAYEKEGNIVKVLTARDYELIYGNKFNDKTQIKIINLKYANAADLAPALNQIKSSIGKVVLDDKSNTLFLMDAPSKLEDMQRLINEADVSTVTEVFNLNYTKAEDLEKKITDILTKGVGRIKIDARSNKAVITDNPKKIAEIEKIINAFDERHKEVLIEAKIIQIILSDDFKMGVNWESLLTRYHNLDLKSYFGILSADATTKGKISIGTVGDNNDYNAFMEALNTIGTTNILSSPRIATVSNQEAKILVGSTEPYVTTTTTTPATGPTTTAEAVNFIDVGVKLYVTPVINRDNFITMKIKPEVSSITSYLTTSQKNTIPIVDTSQAETNVMVKDGVTIVIGGLMKDQDLETVTKLPLLGDLPLLGALFRSKSKAVKKTELVVLLTPHIISGDIDSYGASKSISYNPPTQTPLTSEVQTVPLIKKGISLQIPQPPENRKEASRQEEAVQAALTSTISYEQYCQEVKDKIYKYIEKNYPQEPMAGKVELSFIILSSGELKQQPSVDNEVDSRLKELAIKSVEEAAPFGPFPGGAGKAEEDMHLAILYE